LIPDLDLLSNLQKSMLEEYLDDYPNSLDEYECITKMKEKRGIFMYKMKPKKLTKNEFVFVKGIVLEDDRDYPELEREVFFSRIF